MKQFDNPENKIKDVLREISQNISASQDLKHKIDMEIERRQYRKENKMMRFNVKKIVVAVACICLLVGTVSYAAGRVTQYVSSSPKHGIKKYDEVDKLEDKVGFEIKSVERFSNGYVFTEAVISNTKAIDDNNITVKKFKNIDIEYQKDKNEKERISLYASKSGSVEESTSKDKEKIQCGDVTLHYSQQNYKFVPEGYRFTEEDKAEVEKGNLEIAYGDKNHEVRKMLYSHLTWEKDGIAYNLFGSDLSLSKEEFIGMAKELIE